MTGLLQLAVFEAGVPGQHVDVCSVSPVEELLLPTESLSPAAAREWAAQVTCRSHHAEVLDDALLLISELVTNAVVHGGPPIVLGIECDGSALRVRVRDGSPALPRPRAAEPAAESGRGLTLVELLSDTWGVEPMADAQGVGKHVWFELRR